MVFENDLKYLYSLQTFGSKLGLDRTKKALDAFGNPQNDLKIVHIAGTNGKGSTAAMINQILIEAGYKVGLFVSPYVVEFGERIQVNNEYIPNQDISRLVRIIKEKDVFLTFFEFVTVMAWLYFKEKNVDYVILETGLGGRLDATNVNSSKIQIITSIDIEHANFLGDNIESIAKEKAAIIKNKSAVFVPINIYGLDAIRKVCKEKNSKLKLTKKTDYKLALNGEFQKQNAGIAVEAAKKLGVNDEIIKLGLKNTRWPGRLEFIDKNILLDSAHNPSAIKNLSEFVKTLNFRKLIIVFGVLFDKDYDKMIKLLPKHDYLIFTMPDNHRALDPKKISIESDGVFSRCNDAIKKAKELASKDDLILVTGSIYLVSEIRRLILS